MGPGSSCSVVHHIHAISVLLASPLGCRDDHKDSYRRGDEGRRGGSYGHRDDDRGSKDLHHQSRGRPSGPPPPGGIVRPKRDPTPPEVKAEREKEAELKKLEKAARTIMAMNLNLRAEEKEIFQFFSAAGPIVDIIRICDKNTKRFKGIAYIEFGNVESAMSALVLNGQFMMNMPVSVRPSEANRVRRPALLLLAARRGAAIGASAGSSPPECRPPTLRRRTSSGRRSRRSRRSRPRCSTAWAASRQASASTPSSCRCA